MPKKAGGPPSEEDRTAREAFGRRLKGLMRRAELNHVSLAERSGINRSLVTRLVNGDRRVNGDQVARLSAALGVSPAELWAQTVAPGAELSALAGSEPSGRFSASHAAEGYAVKTDQGEYIGRQLDGIESDEVRAEAMEACSRAIREILHPSKLGAGKVPGRVQRK